MSSDAFERELRGTRRGVDPLRALFELDLFEEVLLGEAGNVQRSSGRQRPLACTLPTGTSASKSRGMDNSVFCRWDWIFSNQMTAAAAIDRLAQHRCNSL